MPQMKRILSEDQRTTAIRSVGIYLIKDLILATRSSRERSDLIM